MTSAVFGKPDTAREALALWDSGQPVFTAEMGGIGPDYEQCIHIMAFEVVRELLRREPLLSSCWDAVEAAQTGDKEDAKRQARAFIGSVEAAVLALPLVRDIGSSDAQWDAAQNLAYITVRKGWAKALSELPDDRIIQVSNHWPTTKQNEPTTVST